MTNFPLYPYQQKALEQFRAMSGKVVMPRYPGRTTLRRIRAVDMQQVYAIMYGRKHKKKRWMSETYHKRIQKKWDKRYGTGLTTQKQPVLDSIKKLLAAPVEFRVMPKMVGSELAELLNDTNRHIRITRVQATEPIDIHTIRPDGVEATTVMRILKERKAYPEAFHIQADFTVNSLDLEDKDNGEQKI